MPGKIYIIDKETKERSELNTGNREQIQKLFGEDFRWLEGFILSNKQEIPTRTLKTLLGVRSREDQPDMELFYTEGMDWRVRVLEAVPQGVFVAWFSAALGPCSEADPYQLKVVLPDHSVQYLSPLKQGNISRFFEHAFNETELAEWIKFNKQYSRDTIITANLETQLLEFNKIPLIAYYASVAIPEKSILAFSYTMGYWMGARVSPEICQDKQVGNILPRTEYSPRKVLIRIYGEAPHQDMIYDEIIDYRKLLKDCGWEGGNKFKNIAGKFLILINSERDTVGLKISLEVLKKGALARKSIIVLKNGKPCTRDGKLLPPDAVIEVEFDKALNQKFYKLAHPKGETGSKLKLKC